MDFANRQGVAAVAFAKIAGVGYFRVNCDTMKQLVVALITFLFTQISFGQENLVPKQYQSIKEVYGDLDKDGTDEKIIVYNVSDKKDEINGVDREVIIFKKAKVSFL